MKSRFSTRSFAAFGLASAIGWSSFSLVSWNPALYAEEKPADSQDTQASLEKSFQELLNDSQLVGRFTMDGGSEAKEERYELRSVSKLDDEGLWGMQTRIKYGDHDVTVPIAVMVEWADKTPVITLDELFIPGLGTFSARVLFHGDRYAGTWQHGERGGHLFGRVERLTADETPAAENTPAAESK